MAITLEVNYAKKLGLPGYSSHQYSITVRTELTDLSQVQTESSRLYQLLQEAVDKDIQEVGFIPPDNYGNNGTLFKEFDHPHMQIVNTSAGSDKQDRFDEFMQKGKEGVVFKHVDAPYTPGRPNAGGTQLKYKFYETASFIVTKPNPKRSVSLILFEGGTVTQMHTSSKGGCLHMPTKRLSADPDPACPKLH